MQSLNWAILVAGIGGLAVALEMLRRSLKRAGEAYNAIDGKLFLIDYEAKLIAKKSEVSREDLLMAAFWEKRERAIIDRMLLTLGVKTYVPPSTPYPPEIQEEIDSLGRWEYLSGRRPSYSDLVGHIGFQLDTKEEEGTPYYLRPAIPGLLSYRKKDRNPFWGSGLATWVEGLENLQDRTLREELEHLQARTLEQIAARNMRTGMQPEAQQLNDELVRYILDQRRKAPPTMTAPIEPEEHKEGGR